MAPTIRPDPDDPSRVIIDTSPPGLDPDVPVSFDEPEDEGLSPEAFVDDPWIDPDPEAEESVEDSAPVDFGSTDAVSDDAGDVVHCQRWLQSSLKSLVAPDLPVDGVPGPRTERAVLRFQQRAHEFGVGPLVADGVAGPRTLAALEQATRTKRPQVREADHADEQAPAPAPETTSDATSVARRLQTGLKILVAPDLTVDGVLGPTTERAVTRFQQRAREFGVGPLAADGNAGPKTLAALEKALEKAAGHSKPGGHDLDQEDARVESAEGPMAKPASKPITGAGVPESVASDLVVTEAVTKDGKTRYTIDAGREQVHFSYWSGRKNAKPYSVSDYSGALTGLVTDAQILAIGYSTSELKILRTNSLKESGGTFGAINTWDDQLVSWGMAQFAGQAGTLAALLADLKEDPLTRASFKRWFVDNGIDVARGDYPWKGGQRRTGMHVVVTADGKTMRGNPGWEYIRTQPRLLGAFMLAGNDVAIQFGQIVYWRDAFLSRAIAKFVGKRADGSGGAVVRRYITSERGIAVLVRLHNWMPAYVVAWTNRFIAELQRQHTGRDLHDPDQWDQGLEDEFVKLVCAERKRVKDGGYDAYIRHFSGQRGTFVTKRRDT